MSAAASQQSERLEELAALPDHSDELAALVGLAAGPPTLSPDAVNLPMIRHWVEAMGDENPVYVSDEAAQAAGYERLIAPPTMLQAWIMRGLRASVAVEEARAAGERGSGPNDIMMALLEDEGLTSVVATNCEQHYGRPLMVGDRVLARSVIESISDPKRTGLGTRTLHHDAHGLRRGPRGRRARGLPCRRSQVQALFDGGEPVATMRFRILKYLPPRAHIPAPAPTASRPSPRTTRSGSRGPGPTGC